MVFLLGADIKLIAPLEVPKLAGRVLALSGVQFFDLKGFLGEVPLPVST